jgi:hypothetical protein
VDIIGITVTPGNSFAAVTVISLKKSESTGEDGAGWPIEVCG